MSSKWAGKRAGLLAVAALVGAPALAAAEGSTIRIEPRPFYGATITIEEGVRVMRALPPERHVIINPDNKTPLSIGINETNVYDRRTSTSNTYNYIGRGRGYPSARFGYLNDAGAPRGYWRRAGN